MHTRKGSEPGSTHKKKPVHFHTGGRDFPAVVVFVICWIVHENYFGVIPVFRFAQVFGPSFPPTDPQSTDFARCLAGAAFRGHGQNMTAAAAKPGPISSPKSRNQTHEDDDEDEDGEAKPTRMGGGGRPVFM